MDATQSSAVKGRGAAISARVAEDKNRVSGPELAGDEGKSHGDLASAANERAISARKQFKAFSPLQKA